jgi:hypothetical protein
MHATVQHFKNALDMDDRISATDRISASYSDVTHKKCLILFPQKRMKPVFMFAIFSQCYKTFYHGNLPPFPGHTIILCYKTLLLW